MNSAASTSVRIFLILVLLHVLKRMRRNLLELPQNLLAEQLDFSVSGGVVALSNHITPRPQVTRTNELGLLLVRQDSTGSLAGLLARQALAGVVRHEVVVVPVRRPVCLLVNHGSTHVVFSSVRQHKVILAVLVDEPLRQLAVGQVPVANQ